VKNMANKILALGILAAGLLLVARPAVAHHAWNGYDMVNETTVKGTITNFDWANPHVWMSFDVRDDKGNVQHWDAGGPSPSRMQNTGWNKDTLKPGDEIVASGHKIKDGTFKLRLDKVVVPGGKTLVCYAAPGA
jgi:hypothetical protein